MTGKQKFKNMLIDYEGDIKELKPNQIFVFSSNTQGRHGKGAAKIARKKFGALLGISKRIDRSKLCYLYKRFDKRSPSIYYT